MSAQTYGYRVRPNRRISTGTFVGSRAAVEGEVDLLTGHPLPWFVSAPLGRGRILYGDDLADAGRLPSVSLSERYELRSASDPIRWNLLVDQSPTGYFSQLWEWGEIQRSIGWEPWRLELLPADGEGAAPIAAAQLLVRKLPGAS